MRRLDYGQRYGHSYPTLLGRFLSRMRANGEYRYNDAAEIDVRFDDPAGNAYEIDLKHLETGVPFTRRATTGSTVVR